MKGEANVVEANAVQEKSLETSICKNVALKSRVQPSKDWAALQSEMCSLRSSEDVSAHFRGKLADRRLLVPDVEGAAGKISHCRLSNQIETALQV